MGCFTTNMQLWLHIYLRQREMKEREREENSHVCARDVARPETFFSTSLAKILLGLIWIGTG